MHLSVTIFSHGLIQIQCEYLQQYLAVVVYVMYVTWLNQSSRLSWDLFQIRKIQYIPKLVERPHKHINSETEMQG